MRLFGKLNLELGPTHEKTLKAAHILAEIHGHMSRHQDSEALLAEFVECNKATLREDDPMLSRAWLDRLASLSNVGKADEAEKTLSKAMEDAKRHLGTSHPALSNTYALGGSHKREKRRS